MLYRIYIVKLATHRSLEYPEEFREAELKMYKENSVIMMASMTPSMIQRKKFV